MVIHMKHFKDWYTKDYQSFIEYNIMDVELVDRLEDKMKLIELLLTMNEKSKLYGRSWFSKILGYTYL